MTRKFRMQYLENIRKRYFASDKAGKSAILSEFCRLRAYNRKYAIYLLNNPQKGHSKLRPSKRPIVYGHNVQTIIVDLWEQANFPWSVRLKEIIRLWLPWIRMRHKIDKTTETLLLNISKNTIERIIRPYRYQLKKRIYGKTKPGSLLKPRALIPIMVRNSSTGIFTGIAPKLTFNSPAQGLIKNTITRI